MTGRVTPKRSSGPKGPRGARRSRRERITLVGVIGLTVGVIGMGLAVAGASSDDRDDRASTIVTEPLSTFDPTNLTGAARELYDLMEQGDRASVYATYDVDMTNANGAVERATVLEVWQDGDRLRQDVEKTDPDGTTSVMQQYRQGTNTVVCTADGCRLSAGRLNSLAGALLQSLGPKLGSMAVEVRDDAILGYAARCFTVRSGSTTVVVNGTTSTVPTEGGIEVCLDAFDGVILLEEEAGTRVLLAHRDAMVDPSVFTIPASAAPASSSPN